MNELKEIIQIVVNSKLADTAPALVGTILLVGAVLLFIAWQMKVTRDFIKDLFTQHETAEVTQFSKIDALTTAVAENTTAVKELAAEQKRITDRLTDLERTGEHKPLPPKE